MLARLNLRQDAREARKVARRAARLFSNRGSDAWATKAEAVALAAEVMNGSRRPALLDEAADIAGRLRTQGLVHDASAVLLQSARVAVRLDDLPTARGRVRGVRQRADAPLENRLLQHEVRAELSLAGGRRKDAMQHVRDGLASLHDWQSSFGSLDLQSSLVGHGRGLAVAGLRMAVEDGRPEVVFEWTERARALTSRVAAVRPPDDPDGAARLQELRELHAQIRAADAEGRPVVALVRKSSRLQQQIRERAWHDPGSGLVTEPTTLDQLQAQLGQQDGVMLVHVVTHGRLRLLVATGDDTRVLDLGDWAPVGRILDGLRADLDVSAAHLPPPLRQVVLDSLDDRLATLSRHLVAPAADLVGDDRPVLIVPTGRLAGTPWTMLPGLRGRPVTMPRSASLWVAHQHAPDHPRRRAAFVAGPRVERAAEEVRRAAAAWGERAAVVASADATAAHVTEAAHSADVMHVAAHGRHSADNPLFSGLELADGPWFGYDIDRLSAVPRTVVLSACELGRSTVRWGEETVGMTQAWLHAGACTVIASPASVDDDVACEVLAETHVRLAAGRAPAYALADATAALGLGARSSFMCFGAGW
ncbi:CHAT domain-containing protein [Luteipulveratus flavus]|uniref:CHAT domain-containing protein n=1 Tax=Luteipulveratus flavus TaxID=3031728 RepID=A0ABT6CA07_9MICO|nr:CHAT domain-containing protein [Luteipulveratus sp. YIM 133296]MDF8265152.1 CHAT domain-containing protein [Luteipulveratus sp. YIM 133296]